MDYIDRRRAGLERDLSRMERDRRRRLSRAWILRSRLASASFDDPQRVERLAHAIADSMAAVSMFRHFEESDRHEIAVLDTVRESCADVNGSCRFLTCHGHCGSPTVDGSRWCAKHSDIWTFSGGHAAGVWRRLRPARVRDSIVLIVDRPEPMSMAKILETARRSARILECGLYPLADGLTEQEARRWTMSPDPDENPENESEGNGVKPKREPHAVLAPDGEN